MNIINIYPSKKPGMKYQIRVNLETGFMLEKWDVEFQYDDLVARLREDYPGCQIKGTKNEFPS